MVDIVIKEETSRMESERQDDVLQIPLFDLPASAGFGLPLEGDYRTIIEAPDTPLNRKADFLYSCRRGTAWSQTTATAISFW